MAIKRLISPPSDFHIWQLDQIHVLFCLYKTLKFYILINCWTMSFTRNIKVDPPILVPLAWSKVKLLLGPTPASIRPQMADSHILSWGLKRISLSTHSYNSLTIFKSQGDQSQWIICDWLGCRNRCWLCCYCREHSHLCWQCCIRKQMIEPMILSFCIQECVQETFLVN
jgi:hypothetical protein